MSYAENMGHNVQPFKYNGKELTIMNGLNLYDYHARQYDPAVGRFLTIDPLAEKYPWVSPYAYCLNNPVKFVDPDGKQVFFGMNMPFSPLLGISDPIMISNKPIVTETMVRMGRATTEVLGKTESHHLIPRSLKGNEVVRSAREGGFKLEGKENKIPVEKFNKITGEGQHGKHPNYTNQIKEQIKDFKKENPNFTSEQAAKAVREIKNDAKNIIRNTPDVKINDLKLNEITLPIDNTRITTPLVIDLEILKKN